MTINSPVTITVARASDQPSSNGRYQYEVRVNGVPRGTYDTKKQAEFAAAEIGEQA